MNNILSYFLYKITHTYISIKPYIINTYYLWRAYKGLGFLRVNFRLERVPNLRLVGRRPVSPWCDVRGASLSRKINSFFSPSHIAA